MPYGYIILNDDEQPIGAGTTAAAAWADAEQVLQSEGFTLGDEDADADEDGRIPVPDYLFRILPATAELIHRFRMFGGSEELAWRMVDDVAVCVSDDRAHLR